MIFSIQSRDEKFLNEIYKKSMKELNDFFEFKWTKNKPKLFLVKDRKTINALTEKKRPAWSVGWVNQGDVYVLDKDNYEKESSHTYSDEGYFRLIKHELAHSFTQALTGIFDKPLKPDWLWEGIAIYLSSQNKVKKKPSELKTFLDHYTNENKNTEVYNESGFAIEFLVENFGKQKLLDLIKSLKNINSEKEFNKRFEEIYGFGLKYENFQNSSKQ